MPDARSPDFYLTSVEHRGDLSRIRACSRRTRVTGPNDAEYLWVKVAPPILGQPFGLGGADISDVVLSPHYVGDSLFPVRHWPTAVFVYRARNPRTVFDLKKFMAEDVEMIAWGEVYQTEASARSAFEEGVGGR